MPKAQAIQINWQFTGSAGIMQVEHTADCFGGAWFKSPLSTEVWHPRHIWRETAFQFAEVLILQESRLLQHQSRKTSAWLYKLLHVTCVVMFSTTHLQPACTPYGQCLNRPVTPFILPSTNPSKMNQLQWFLVHNFWRKFDGRKLQICPPHRSVNCGFIMLKCGGASDR